MEVHALNSNNGDHERLVSSELAPKSNESLTAQISSSINIYAPEDDPNRIQHVSDFTIYIPNMLRLYIFYISSKA